MTRHKLFLSMAAIGCALSLCTQARAEGRRGPHGPPQEAFDACSSSASGDTCSFTIGTATINGTCFNGPRTNGALACVPEHRRMHPPQEAIDACAQLSVGDACTVVLHPLEGTCRAPRDDAGVIACVPNGRPMP